MKSSGLLPALALWYQKIPQEPLIDKRPALEIHVNLWRRLGRAKKETDRNYLDLGIRILEPRDLAALHLYVPFQNIEDKIKDLGLLIKRQEIASAVFNEVLDVESNHGNLQSFFIRKNGNHFLTVHPINIKSDLNISARKDGSIITFKKDICSSFGTQGEHYIRVRFILDEKEAETFTSDVSAEDGFLLSSITTSEITEIRINEARSIPDEVQIYAKNNTWLLPQILAIHYFLVRDISFDLIASHASFNKIRRMEPEWDEYLGSEFPRGSARNMLIYHWKKTAAGNDADVGDFVSLAKFRRSKGNVYIYVFIVVILGSLGSGLHSSLSILLSDPKWPDKGWSGLLWEPPPVWSGFTATFWIAIVLVLFLSWPRIGSRLFSTRDICLSQWVRSPFRKFRAWFKKG